MASADQRERGREREKLTSVFIRRYKKIVACASYAAKYRRNFTYVYSTLTPGLVKIIGWQPEGKAQGPKRKMRVGRVRVDFMKLSGTR